jgi:hypothetical protein
MFSKLVALIDHLGFVEHFHERMSLMLNGTPRALIIYQNKTSAILFVAKCVGILRTKHLTAIMH